MHWATEECIGFLGLVRRHVVPCLVKSLPVLTYVLQLADTANLPEVTESD